MGAKKRELKQPQLANPPALPASPDFLQIGLEYLRVYGAGAWKAQEAVTGSAGIHSFHLRESSIVRNHLTNCEDFRFSCPAPWHIKISLPFSYGLVWR